MLRERIEIYLILNCHTREMCVSRRLIEFQRRVIAWRSFNSFKLPSPSTRQLQLEKVKLCFLNLNPALVNKLCFSWTFCDFTILQPRLKKLVFYTFKNQATQKLKLGAYSQLTRFILKRLQIIYCLSVHIVFLQYF